MRDLDYYRCMGAEALLEHARECGINPDMAVAIAERLDHVTNGRYGNYPSMGGRYTFTTRSEA
jgi:hypothetical protein